MMAASPLMFANSNHRKTQAFTVVELLVVIGIIAALISLLLPAIVGAREQANSVTCISHISQLGTALVNLAQENRGDYPSNTTSPAPGISWWDLDSLGRFVTMPRDSRGGCVYTCPSDPNGQISY